MRISRRSRASLIAISLFAFALRIHALFFNSFHADEALFASWARQIAVWRDPLLLGQSVDKPPLLFYLQALFFPIQGPVEWAARLPNFIASCLLVPLVAVLVWQLYRDQLAAVAASLLAALSPLAIQFSATAFTDPLLSVLLLTSLTALAAGYRRRVAAARPDDSRIWTSAGFIFGLAAAAKYQAWLFMPLIMAVGMLGGARWRDGRNWLLGLLKAMIPLIIWILLRSDQAPMWSRQLANFGGLRLAYSWEIWPRLAAWGDQLQYILPPAVLIFSLALVFLGDTGLSGEGWDSLLLSFVLGYLLLHSVLAIPVWDRYLLPITPLLFALCGRGISGLARYAAGIVAGSRAGRQASRWVPYALAAVLLIGMLPAALTARVGGYPIGGAPDADQGAADIASALADQPYGTVLYDHWYSWQWRYHLFDKRVYTSWFPDPDSLGEQLQVFGRDGNAHYLALPNSDAGTPVIRSVEAAGFGLQLVTEDDGVPEKAAGILLYRIIAED